MEYYRRSKNTYSEKKDRKRKNTLQAAVAEYLRSRGNIKHGKKSSKEDRKQMARNWECCCRFNGSSQVKLKAEFIGCHRTQRYFLAARLYFFLFDHVCACASTSFQTLGCCDEARFLQGKTYKMDSSGLVS